MHPNAFTALLPALQQAFDCFALVLNLLKVGLREGPAPTAERLDAALAGCQDGLSRQVCLVNWYFRCYTLPVLASHVLRYEVIEAASGATLARLHPAAAGVRGALSARNRNAVYDRGFMHRARPSGASEDNRGNGTGG
jgi:hypothetical protein